MDTPEGGLNPQAVRYFADVEGGYAKVVWMPTHDAEHEVTFLRESRPFVRVSQDGKLLPQVGEVLDVIAEYKLTLATGHVSPEEMLMIVAKPRSAASNTSSSPIPTFRPPASIPARRKPS